MSNNEKIKEVTTSDDEDYHDASSKINEEIIEEIIRQNESLSLDDEDEKQKKESKSTAERIEQIISGPREGGGGGGGKEAADDQKKENFLDCIDFTEEDEDLEEKKIREENMTEADLLENKQIAEDARLDGNELFKNQKYEESIQSYNSALRVIPTKYLTQRAILYANRAAAKIKLGSPKSAIDDCTKAIELDDHYLKAFLRRAKLYEETDKLDESLEDFQHVLKLDPGNREANEALIRLPPKIEERNEKLKTEMMGKLKDLGNLFLKPFGLSTANFEMQKNPDSEGYSINFKQNPN